MLNGAAWARLQEPLAPEPEQGLAPSVLTRDVVFWREGETLRLRATWTLTADEPAWFASTLLSSGLHVDRVTWNGRPAMLLAADTTLVIGRVTGATTVVAEATVPQDPQRGPVPVGLMAAPRGTVQVRTDSGLQGQVLAEGIVAVDGRWWTGQTMMTVQIAQPVTRARDRRTLAMATVGVGLTVEEGAIHGQARVQWRLRQGSVSEVSLRARHVGSDLSVKGAQVKAWRREGDRVVVTLQQATAGLVDLSLRWSVPVPDGDISRVPVPELVPDGAFRTEASLQLARSGELEVLPDLSGWQPVAASELPETGRGLVEGTPTAAYVAGAAGRAGALDLLRYVPVSGPPVVVDVAALTVAVSPEGRTLTRGLYTVRNERGAHLRVQAPGGAIIVGARVQDGPVTPVSDGEGWLIPLPRSLETVDGLLSFPVEVVLLGDGTPWARRELRDVALPVLDAPIAVNRVTVHLPPRWKNDADDGAGGLVDDFTEGQTLAYGFGLGGEDEAQADQKWQDAMSAYMRNDFDEADALLDDLEDLGAANENVGKLRSNLDVVQGRDAGTKSIQARRVRAQASSRGQAEYWAQEEALEEAEKAWQAGDLDKAASSYERASSLSKKLDKLEQQESVEQDQRQKLAEAMSSTIALRREQMNLLPAPAGSVADSKEVGAFEDLYDLEGAVVDLAHEGRLDDEAPVAGDSSAVLDLQQQAEGDGIEGSELLDFIAKDEAERGKVPVPEDVSGDMMGVGGGVMGGVLGGSMGAVGHGAGGGGAASAVGSVEVRSRAAFGRGGRNAEAAPSRMESQVVDIQAVEVRSAGGIGRGRGIAIGAKKKSAPRSAEPASPKPARDSFDGDDMESFEPAPDGVAFDTANIQGSFEALEVTSTRLSVVVPVLGETLRFQHLLLPAGAAHTVSIDARADRTVPRRPE